MDYTIKHVTTAKELDVVLAFDKKVFGFPSERHSPAYSREKWLERMKTHSDLMLYAESGEEVIGIVFGRIENSNSITVGPVAVDERFRKHGVARKLMLLLEKRALKHEIRHLGLGAVESAEGFYQKLGYTGTLLIQSEKHSIEELLSLNDKYPVKSTSIYDDTVNQVFLDLPSPDRELQRRYENTLPGCYTQMIFGKTIKTEDFTIADDTGNYARHAKYWEWGNLDHDRTPDDEKNYTFAKQYGNSILIPMCAWGHLGAYMAQRGMHVTAFDITPEMIEEGKKRFGSIKNLRLFVGDATNFRFDIEPVDICAFAEFGWIHSIDELKKALACINYHLRDGGYLIIEEFIGAYDSQTGLETFRVKNNPYPDRTVYKTGTTRNEAATRRCYISQTVYIEHDDGRKEQFDHNFYLQGYTREEWLSALRECGFEVKAEYRNRKKKPWREGDEDWIVEAVKCAKGKISFSEVLFQLTDDTGVASSSRIEWLTENDVAKLNEHLLLAGQNPHTDEWFRDIYRQGTARYCLLYNDNLPVARGAVEPLSEQEWEAADIRTAKDYRNRGFAKEVLRFLSQHIIEHGKLATCRTEKNNIAMQKVLKSIGYKELGE